MYPNEIHKLIEEGALKVAPLRARSVRDAARIRAALGKPAPRTS